MLLSDRKLRIYGPVAFAIIYYVFFILQMFVMPHKTEEGQLLKSMAAAVLFVLLIWEPVRLVILYTQKKWGNAKIQLQRRLILALILIPFAFALGIGGQILENRLIWQIKAPKIRLEFFLGTIGINMIFILAEVALYESYFMINKWHQIALEAKELKKANLQLQFDSLKVQIQPHFLFNTLNTLIGLIRLDSNSAIRFTEEMAYVYRYLLDANEGPLISLEEELQFAKAYFFLLKTRYSEGLHLEIAGESYGQEFQVPPLSLQLLIENAVKHNIITRNRPLFIKIQIHPEKQLLQVINNLQKKSPSFISGHGLMHLKRKFELLHIPGLVTREELHQFVVTLPLVNSNIYAGSNH